jgi:hypothetical protein
VFFFEIPNNLDLSKQYTLSAETDVDSAGCKNISKINIIGKRVCLPGDSFDTDFGKPTDSYMDDEITKGRKETDDNGKDIDSNLCDGSVYIDVDKTIGGKRKTRVVYFEWDSEQDPAWLSSIEDDYIIKEAMLSYSFNLVQTQAILQIYKNATWVNICRTAGGTGNQSIAVCPNSPLNLTKYIQNVTEAKDVKIRYLTWRDNENQPGMVTGQWHTEVLCIKLRIKAECRNVASCGDGIWQPDVDRSCEYNSLPGGPGYNESCRNSTYGADACTYCGDGTWQPDHEECDYKCTAQDCTGGGYDRYCTRECKLGPFADISCVGLTISGGRCISLRPTSAEDCTTVDCNIVCNVNKNGDSATDVDIMDLTSLSNAIDSHSSDMTYDIDGDGTVAADDYDICSRFLHNN